VNDAKAVRRLATIEFLQDKELVDELLEQLAEGASLRDLCQAYDLVYPTTMRYLAKHYHDDYEAAKEVRADSALDEMADVEKRLEDGDTDFNTARELFKSKQWRAERLNPKRYSPKQTVDMNVTDKTRLHLEAVRRLTQITIRPAGPALPAPPAPPQGLGHDVPIANQDTAIDTDFTEVSNTTVATVVPTDTTASQ
jgi:hypothetical protein